MSTAFDAWLASQQPQQNKQAVDALVPGQVGAGANPGTTGQLDSPIQDASNSQIGLQRAAQGQAPIVAPAADGGAGYSNPPPATSPSLQMFADVAKAATIEKEARSFARDTYLEIKQAFSGGEAPEVAAPAQDSTKAASDDPLAPFREAGRQWARAGR